jgi:hypothetical protein
MKKYIVSTCLCLTMLALSGCKKAPDSEKTAGAEDASAGEKSYAALLDFKNVLPTDISYGDLPSTRGPSGFVAKFDALVYFGLDSDAKLVSTIRYFNAVGNDYPAIKQRMVACVGQLDANIANKCDGQFAQLSLDQLRFRGPTNVVFASRNASLKFGTEPLVFSKSLDRTHTDYPDGKKAKPNKSFYNAQVFQEGSRQLVYVSNYYTKKNGGNGNGNGTGDTPIGTTENYWYALNLFMTVDQVGGAPVRIIIDPDAGNVGAGPP